MFTAGSAHQPSALCVCVCVWVYVYMCRYVHMCICVYVWVCVCVYMCVCGSSWPWAVPAPPSLLPSYLGQRLAGRRAYLPSRSQGWCRSRPCPWGF